MMWDVWIVTGVNENLGSGHFQRMAALAWRLRHRYCMRVCMRVMPCVGTIPHEIQEFIQNDVDGAQLILRDMRDSSIEEIAWLKTKGKVCVIDDRGMGRKIADFRIEILPHYVKTDDIIEGNFLYGFNFMRSLELIDAETVEKNIDIAIYGGNKRTKELLISLIPENARYCLVGGEKIFLGEKGIYERAENINYAFSLCASKVALSHFGIFLYEASLTKCHVDSINPTDYHSRLSDCAQNRIRITNFGTWNSLNVNEAQKTIRLQIQRPISCEIFPSQILSTALGSIDAFIEGLFGML
ncbi:MAG: hypothetical protein N2316_01845 [Spirochaetes bacterium]|nr:hypothetical protein [Spirochaetota bacterium]